MKTSLNSLDVLAIVKELKKILADSRISKIFQVTPDELKIQLNLPEIGKSYLVIEAGKRVHLTEYPKPSPQTPSTFTMTLRKHIGNGIIREVKQLGFDRIIEFKIERVGEYYLIAELFGKGNVVLTEKDYTILAVMKPEKYKDRELLIHREYNPPPQKINPFDVTPEELVKIVSDSKSDVVRTLATKLGLGGVISEEICLLSRVDKRKVEIDYAEASEILKAIKQLKDNIEGKGFIIFDNSTPLDVVPLEMEFYREKRRKEFESFNNAIDEYFTKYEIERIESETEQKYLEKLGKLKARLEEQTQTLQKYIETEKKLRKKGDLIFQNFGVVEDILKTISEAKKNFSWKEIDRRIRNSQGKILAADLVKKILPKEGSVILQLNGEEIILDIKKSAGENANEYYSQAKKAKNKIAGAKEAIEKTKAEIQKIEELGEKAVYIEEAKPRKKTKRKKEWYEKFRWFISSDGFLVLGGRDATSNEILVKKHMTNSDIFIHADIQGAPAVIIKTEGKEVPEQTIKEAFDFAASYSKAWKHGIFALDVYWVTPEQVSKTAEHGEYLAKGAFIIRGKKNYGSGKVEVAIGVKLDETPKVIGGPKHSIEKRADYYVTIVPGKMKSKEIAEKIKKLWLQMASEEDREKIRIINIEEIQEFLPAGGSEISTKV